MFHKKTIPLSSEHPILSDIVAERENMKKAADVEILIVGNEILTGDILDTNTHWLCKMVHGRGGTVVRVTVVPDQVEVIAEAVRAAIDRDTDILFTSGGLGPTPDDLTLEAVAKGTGRKIVLHPGALEMIKKQYDYFFTKGIVSQRKLTPARKKMAFLPQGAEPLFNGTGIAPGVFLQFQQTAIISVPGVPSEQQAIINTSLKQFLDQVFGDGAALSRRLTIKCGGESLVEPALRKIIEQYPEVYTKSLASALGENPELDILMTITGVGEKEALLNKAFNELCSRVTELGLPIEIKDAC